MIDRPDLGPCCGCGTPYGVRTVIMLDRRGPELGRGWGCVVCQLPSDGAVAVLCDRCAEAKPMRIENVCVGYPNAAKRVGVDEYPLVPFSHDMGKHGNETYGGLLPH